MQPRCAGQLRLAGGQEQEVGELLHRQFQREMPRDVDAGKALRVFCVGIDTHTGGLQHLERGEDAAQTREAVDTRCADADHGLEAVLLRLLPHRLAALRRSLVDVADQYLQPSGVGIRQTGGDGSRRVRHAQNDLKHQLRTVPVLRHRRQPRPDDSLGNIGFEGKLGMGDPQLLGHAHRQAGSPRERVELDVPMRPEDLLDLADVLLIRAQQMADLPVSSPDFPDDRPAGRQVCQLREDVLDGLQVVGALPQHLLPADVFYLVLSHSLLLSSTTIFLYPACASRCGRGRWRQGR